MRRPRGAARCWHGAGSAGGGRCWRTARTPVPSNISRWRAACGGATPPCGCWTCPASVSRPPWRTRDACTISWRASWSSWNNTKTRPGGGGHSFGAFLLQAALARHPAARPAVHRLVLVSVGSLYPQLHARWWRWRTLWWACFFKFRCWAGALAAPGSPSAKKPWRGGWTCACDSFPRGREHAVPVPARAGPPARGPGRATAPWAPWASRSPRGGTRTRSSRARRRAARPRSTAAAAVVLGGGHQPLLDTPQGEKMGDHLIALALLRARRPAGRVHMIDT